MSESDDDTGTFTRQEIVDLCQAMIELGAMSAALEHLHEGRDVFGISASGVNKAVDALAKKVQVKFKKMLKGKFKPAETAHAD